MTLYLAAAGGLGDTFDDVIQTCQSAVCEDDWKHTRQERETYHVM